MSRTVTICPPVGLYRLMIPADFPTRIRNALQRQLNAAVAGCSGLLQAFEQTGFVHHLRDLAAIVRK